jgi:hypothetical protein
MRIKYKKILILLAVSIIIFQQCDTTEPPANVKKNPREYTWTVDTLLYPESLQTLMSSIWGSSANNIYVTGHCDDIKGQLWHFDGTQWTSLYISMGFAYTPYAIFGFSSNNIWIAGERIYDNPNPPPNFIDSSFIMKYDGNSWKNIIVHGRSLYTIWGNSPDNIWFGGLNGILFHWDGTSIKKDSIPYFAPEYSQVFSIYGKSSDEAYFMLYSSLIQDHMYLFMRKQNNWSVIDSTVWGWTRDKLWISEYANIYETGSSGFFKWNGSRWDNLLGDFNGFTFGIEALSENNMFIVGWDFATPIRGLVYHYNGKDFYLYENLKLDDVTFYDAWWNGTEVFIVGTTGRYPQKTIILLGK